MAASGGHVHPRASRASHAGPTGSPSTPLTCEPSGDTTTSLKASFGNELIPTEVLLTNGPGPLRFEGRQCYGLHRIKEKKEGRRVLAVALQGVGSQGAEGVTWSPG